MVIPDTIRSLRRWPIAAAALAAAVALLAGCGTPTESTTSSAASPSNTSTNPTSAAPPSVSSVSPADYANPRSPGAYLWSYATNPLRECAIYPVAASAYVTCSVPFPASTPPVTTDAGPKPPNAIQITDLGVANTTIESLSPTAPPTLPANSRITIGDITCTALSNSGIDCATPRGRFRYASGRLTSSPPTSTSEPSTPTDGPPMDHYTEATTPVPAGTACGAATRRTVVKVWFPRNRGGLLYAASGSVSAAFS